LIVVESLLLGVVGAGLGLGLGVMLALIISAIGIPMPPPPNANLGYMAQIQIIPSVLLISGLIGILATVLAAILPARHVSRTPVVEALRQNF
jgi:putative ABC transport system permease protein